MNANRYVVYTQKHALHIHCSLTVFYIKKSVTFFCFIQLDKSTLQVLNRERIDI